MTTIVPHPLTNDNVESSVNHGPKLLTNSVGCLVLDDSNNHSIESLIPDDFVESPVKGDNHGPKSIDSSVECLALDDSDNHTIHNPIPNEKHGPASANDDAESPLRDDNCGSKSSVECLVLDDSDNHSVESPIHEGKCGPASTKNDNVESPVSSDNYGLRSLNNHGVKHPDSSVGVDGIVPPESDTFDYHQSRKRHEPCEPTRKGKRVRKKVEYFSSLK